MNENHTNQQGLTLEEIAVHKQALKIAIAEQQKNVNEAYRQVVAQFSYSENFGKAPSTLHHRKSFLTQKLPYINNRSHQPHIQLLILRFG